jgi:peptide/nickel transport system ATP-binding protein
MSADVILSVRQLQVHFPAAKDWLGRPREHVHALNGVDLDLRSGETLGVVGESGCGKTTLAQALLGLVRPTAGRIEWIRAAGARANPQIVFQDPQSSLDPRLPAWRIIGEPLYVLRRGRIGWAGLKRAAVEAAALVEIPAEHLDRFPHEFSGGQRQRLAIARALVSGPDAIVLDEPTSALDISVQAQILNLLNDLQRARGLTYLLISHNVAVIRHMCDRVAVMYLGQIVELGESEAVLGRPRHPYTRLLLESVPRLGVPVPADAAASSTELPSNRRLPRGCFFRDRCPLARDGCDRPQALLGDGTDPARLVRCHVQGP